MVIPTILRSTGKRKCSIVQAIFWTKQIKDGKISVRFRSQPKKDEIPLDKFFQNEIFVAMIQKPLILTKTNETYNITLKVHGGGFSGQAGAAALAISRGLAKIKSAHHKILRAQGMLTRDSRVKERRKPGLKKARKAPQFSKR